MKNKEITHMYMQKISSLRTSMAVLMAMTASGSLFAATHNIAFRRAVYQSSAADYTHVGHLATDGKVTDGPVQRLMVKSEFPDKSPEGEAPRNAIDDKRDTKWLVFESKCWLEVALPAPARATSYAIMSANDDSKRDPQKWRILASNDGATFEELASMEKQGFGKRRERKTGRMGELGERSAPPRLGQGDREKQRRDQADDETGDRS